MFRLKRPVWHSKRGHSAFPPGPLFCGASLVPGRGTSTASPNMDKACIRYLLRRARRPIRAPIWFVTLAGWDDGGGPPDAPTRRPAAGYEPRRQPSAGAGPKQAGGVLFGIENRRPRTRTVPARKLAGHLPQRLIASPICRTMRARGAGLAGVTASPATARATENRLVGSEGVDAAEISCSASLARDLINTPRERHGPGGVNRRRATSRRPRQDRRHRRRRSAYRIFR